MKLKHPSPALVIALIALFVSLSGTAVAAGVVPLAKRALVANNAQKLQGRTARQVASLAGPASSAASLVASASAPFSLAAGEEKEFSVPCPAGGKAVSGGFTTPGVVIGADTHPSADGGSWGVYLINLSETQPASGTAYAMCVR